jgi:hypothetical protein
LAALRAAAFRPRRCSWLALSATAHRALAATESNPLFPRPALTVAPNPHPSGYSLTKGGLQALDALQALTHLSVASCPAVDAAALATLAARRPGLALN